MFESIGQCVVALLFLMLLTWLVDRYEVVVYDIGRWLNKRFRKND